MPGQLDDAIAGWFRRFPGWTESREDAYLTFPVLRGLSVKLRAGRELEVKACHVLQSRFYVELLSAPVE
jgi:hypothetical protein